MLFSIVLVAVGCSNAEPTSTEATSTPVEVTADWLSAVAVVDEGALDALVEPVGLIVVAAVENQLRSDETVALLEAGTLESVWSFLKRKKVHEPLGKVLMELNLVTEETVEQEIEAQIMDVLQDVLSWDEGTMHLDPVDLHAENLQFGDCLQVGIPLARLADTV